MSVPGQQQMMGSPNPNMMVGMNSPMAQGYVQQPQMGPGPQ